MKSMVLKKLKLINNSFFYSLIVNSNTILNYVSLDELVVYIYKLSKIKQSWNKLILISQNINIIRLLGRSGKKKYFLNKLFNKLKKYFINIFLKSKFYFLQMKI